MDKEPTLGQAVADKVSGMSSIFAQTLGSKDQDAQDQLTTEERRASVRHVGGMVGDALRPMYHV